MKWPCLVREKARMSWVTYSGPVMALAVNSDGKYMVRNEETFSLEKRQFKITNSRYKNVSSYLFAKKATMEICVVLKYWNVPSAYN